MMMISLERWFVFVFLFILQASQKPVSSFSVTPSATKFIFDPAAAATRTRIASRQRLLTPFLWRATPPSSSAPSSSSRHLAFRPDDENSDNDSNNNNNNNSQNKQQDALLTTVMKSTIVSNPKRAIFFSLAMITAGAVLGPFLDSYHSAFHVLEYNQPISFVLWGTSAEHPALTTAWWVPELFGLAGFIIGWLYILLDTVTVYNANTSNNNTHDRRPRPSPPKILIGIALFTFQYWLSGALYQSGTVDRTTILNIMSLVATIGFYYLDRSMTGFVASTATALGGPLIETVLITTSRIPGSSLFATSGYHYTDLGETGFFPLWIVPVYFLGGPAVGNLARGIWNNLSSTTTLATGAIVSSSDEEQTSTMDAATTATIPKCTICNDTRCVSCPNCNGAGEYLAMGNIVTKCTSCRGRGFVICRSCFANYNENPEDIEAIRDFVSRRPD